MKIIGPIAGVGSRLAPFTFNKPKAFIKVAGKRVIDHILQNFVETFPAGTTDLVFVVGYKKRQFQRYLQARYADHFRLHFVEQKPVNRAGGNVPVFGGLGEAIYLTEPTIFTEDTPDGDDCLIFLADMVFPAEKIVAQYLRGHYTSAIDGLITVMEVPREQAHHYGVVVTDARGVIQEMVEKPATYVSNLAIAGIYVFNKRATRRLFEILAGQWHEHKASKRGSEFQFTPALQALVAEGFEIRAERLESRLLDFGRPDTLIEGNRYLLERLPQSRAFFKDLQAEVHDSHVTPPVHVGRDCRVTRCNLGPFVSVGDGCSLENCVIENTVIGDNTTLRNVITARSIIGNSAHLENLSKAGIVVGDRSRLTASSRRERPEKN